MSLATDCSLEVKESAALSEQSRQGDTLRVWQLHQPMVIG